MNKNNWVAITVFVVTILIVASGIYTAITVGTKWGWKEVYDKGVEAGHRTGYNDAYSDYVMMMTNRNQRFAVFIERYGSIHDTPWKAFNTREQMFLCSYGSPGNKMDSEDLFKVFRKFGEKTSASKIVDFSLDNSILKCPKCKGEFQWKEMPLLSIYGGE